MNQLAIWHIQSISIITQKSVSTHGPKALLNMMALESSDSIRTEEEKSSGKTHNTLCLCLSIIRTWIVRHFYELKATSIEWIIKNLTYCSQQRRIHKHHYRQYEMQKTPIWMDGWWLIEMRKHAFAHVRVSWCNRLFIIITYTRKKWFASERKMGKRKKNSQNTLASKR